MLHTVHKKNWNRLIILTLPLFLCACPTTDGYRQMLESYRGTSESSLVRAWGIPDNSYVMDNGGKVLQYKYSDTVMLSGGTTTTPHTTYHSGYISGGAGYGGTYNGTSRGYVTTKNPDREFTTFCETSFLLDTKRKVVDYVFAGDACTAPEVNVTEPLSDTQETAINACQDTLSKNVAQENMLKCIDRNMKK